MEYKIRKANIGDAYGIAKVHVETWRSHYKGQVSDAYLDNLSIDKRAKRWMENFENLKPRTALFVAEDKNNILGFCCVGPAKNIDNIGELYAIYVLPCNQGNGIGSKLMEDGLKFLKKEDFKKVILWVLRSNTSTIEFYKSKGWNFSGNEKREENNGEIFDEVELFREI